MTLSFSFLNHPVTLNLFQGRTLSKAASEIWGEGLITLLKSL
jgi:hypothetical protein